MLTALTHSKRAALDAAARSWANGDLELLPNGLWAATAPDLPADLHRSEDITALCAIGLLLLALHCDGRTTAHITHRGNAAVAQTAPAETPFQGGIA